MEMIVLLVVTVYSPSCGSEGVNKSVSEKHQSRDWFVS